MSNFSTKEPRMLMGFVERLQFEMKQHLDNTWKIPATTFCYGWLLSFLATICLVYITVDLSWNQYALSLPTKLNFAWRLPYESELIVLTTKQMNLKLHKIGDKFLHEAH